MTEALYCFDHLLLLKDYNDPLTHSHIQKHLIISLDDEITCQIEGINVNAKGVCIGSNVSHQVISNNKILVFLIVEYSELSQSISENVLCGRKYHIIDDSIKHIQNVISKCHSDIKKMDSLILSIFSVDKNSLRIKDQRIDKIIDIITQADGIYENIYTNIEEKVNLSKSRISHLFKKEMGVSLSTYLMFEKMHKAFIAMIEGQNITTAAINAGFSSSSHFSAVCKKRYGISFSYLKKDIVFIV